MEKSLPLDTDCSSTRLTINIPRPPRRRVRYSYEGHACMPDHTRTRETQMAIRLLLRGASLRLPSLQYDNINIYSSFHSRAIRVLNTINNVKSTTYWRLVHWD